MTNMKKYNETNADFLKMHIKPGVYYGKPITTLWHRPLVSLKNKI